jgi:putative NADH-flavin reductase
MVRLLLLIGLAIMRSDTTLKVIQMTTKNTTPASTVKPASTGKASLNPVTTASAIGVAKRSGDSFKAEANRLCEILHKHCKAKKLVVGTLKSDCAIMGAFIKELTHLGEQSIKNVSTQFRGAVNEGKVFDLNKNRAEKKGAKASKANETKPVVKLIVVKGSDSFEVAMGLRNAVNDKMFRENYAELAAFLIDALDEFEGE